MGFIAGMACRPVLPVANDRNDVHARILYNEMIVKSYSPVELTYLDHQHS
jgi:hypothetical protein